MASTFGLSDYDVGSVHVAMVQSHDSAGRWLNSPIPGTDIDTVTRKREPSPLVPAAYAEGCPDLSPDGKRLVYQGHASGGRAFAFFSERPDGRDATPVVPTSEPSVSSEPTWLAERWWLPGDPAERIPLSPRAGVRLRSRLR